MIRFFAALILTSLSAFAAFGVIVSEPRSAVAPTTYLVETFETGTGAFNCAVGETDELWTGSTPEGVFLNCNDTTSGTVIEGARQGLLVGSGAQQALITTANGLYTTSGDFCLRISARITVPSLIAFSGAMVSVNGFTLTGRGGAPSEIRLNCANSVSPTADLVVDNVVHEYHIQGNNTTDAGALWMDGVLHGSCTGTGAGGTVQQIQLRSPDAWGSNAILFDDLELTSGACSP